MMKTVVMPVGRILAWAPRLLFSLTALLCILDFAESQFYIERYNYPSRDTFRSDASKCSFVLRLIYPPRCSERKAACTNINCCTCRCDSDEQTFFSIDKGCLTAGSVQDKIKRDHGQRCLFSIRGIGNRYIPSFSHWNDLGDDKVELEIEKQSGKDSLLLNKDDLSCDTSQIAYIRRDGSERLLFENECSEILKVELQQLSFGPAAMILKWNASDSEASWKYLKGKLIKMDIRCKVKSTNISTTSCLLFKVTGSYDDKVTLPLVKSPAVCPLQSTVSPTTTTKPATAIKSTSKETNGTSYRRTDPPGGGESSSDDKSGIIIGPLVVVFILIVAAISLLLFRRYKTRKNDNNNIYMDQQRRRESVPLTDQTSPRYEYAVPSVATTNEGEVKKVDSAASTPEDHHYEGLQINRQGEEYEKPKKTYDYAYTESDKSTIGKEASTLKDQHPNEFEKSNPYYKPASGICEPVYEDMSAGKQHINPYYKPAQETTKVDDGYVAPSTEYIEPDEVKI